MYGIIVSVQSIALAVTGEEVASGEGYAQFPTVKLEFHAWAITNLSNKRLDESQYDNYTYLLYQSRECSVL